jgi:hypothetical protein
VTPKPAEPWAVIHLVLETAVTHLVQMQKPAEPWAVIQPVTDQPVMVPVEP